MNAAQSIFDELVQNGESAILRLVEDAEPEYLHLDFKQRPQQKDLQELLAKALSGFANADGGVLVFGVAEEKGLRLRRAEPFEDAARFEQELNSLFPRLVAFPIPGVITETIESNQDGRGYVVVLVPASDLAPHRSEKDKRYYRRSGDSFRPMEHYELADMFGRRAHPVLQLVGLLERLIPVRDGYAFRLTVGLKNIGRGLARFPSLDVTHLDSRFSFDRFGLDGNRRFGLTPFPSLSRNTFRGDMNEVVHAKGIVPVFQLTYGETSDDVEHGNGDHELRARIAADGSPLATWVIRVRGSDLDALGRSRSEPVAVPIIGEQVDDGSLEPLW